MRESSSRSPKRILFSLLILLPVAFSVSVPLPEASAAATQLRNDNNAVGGYHGSWDAGDVVGAVLTPDEPMYPVRVLSVEFSLYNGFDGAEDAAVVRVCIYSVLNGSPDSLLGCARPALITTFYPDLVSVDLSSLEIVIQSPHSFMAAIEYVVGTGGQVPSTLTDTSTGIPEAKNYYSRNGEETWFEHYDFWLSPDEVGYNAVRANIDMNYGLKSRFAYLPLTLKSHTGPEPSAPPVLAGWWIDTWSDNGTTLDVTYTQGAGTASERTSVHRGFSPFGDLIYQEVYVYRTGEDVYGRQLNLTRVEIWPYCDGVVRQAFLIAGGAIHYPAATEIEQSDAAFTLQKEVSYERDSCHLTGGSGGAGLSGHVSTLAGSMTYMGSVDYTFTGQDGQLLAPGSVERISYHLGSRPYAETRTVYTREYERSGGSWRVVTETVRTATTYAEGGQRESEIVILWERNQYGTITGKSGSGVSEGTEILDGAPVYYVGSITLDYGFSSIGWYKTGYREERSAETHLPKRLPFEVFFTDDPELGG